MKAGQGARVAIPGSATGAGIRIERRPAGPEVIDELGSPMPDCSRFLERLGARGLSPHTVTAYAYDLALVHRWMREAAVTLGDMNDDLVHRFIAWERGREAQPKSINRRLNTLRLFYRFVHGRELPGGSETRLGFVRRRRDWELGLQSLPTRSTRQLRVKEPGRVVEPLSIEQVRELIGSLRRYRDLAIAYLMLLCGLRSQEVILVRGADVDFVDRRIKVRGKGNKERVVPLPKLVLELLRRYTALERPANCPSGHLFVVLQGRRRGQAMSRAALRRVFRTRRQQASLHNANPHRLRHTFGADMARSGVRLPVLQRMMGHTKPETTLKYVTLSAVDIAAEFDRAIGAIEARYQQNDTEEEGE
jgi:integrase/recombinase XerC